MVLLYNMLLYTLYILCSFWLNDEKRHYWKWLFSKIRIYSLTITQLFCSRLFFSSRYFSVFYIWVLKITWETFRYIFFKPKKQILNQKWLNLMKTSGCSLIITPLYHLFRKGMVSFFRLYVTYKNNRMNRIV